ncbi:MAG: SDR family NAD(P)-dependent oxidoreductase [Pseudomonadota bacterium]
MPSWLKPGNTAVITGGANGIGLAAATRFLNDGMNVVIADVNEDALSAAADYLASDQLKTFTCDVAELLEVNALREFVLAEHGSVDCLMNNAGASVTRAVPWEDLDGWKRQQDINLWGIIHGCHAFIPSMLKSSTPVAVINTGSKQGITNPPGGYAYNLSKAGVINYTQSVAHALRQIEYCPVAAHLLIPGFTYSNMIARFVPEKPPGAWSCEQVIDYMIEHLDNNDFYIICPDNDTPAELDNRRMQWNLDDMIKNRPALSRWHPDFAADFESFVAD